MEIKIGSKSDNKLLHRKEVAFTVIGEASVKADQVKTEVCKMESLSPDSTVVSRIDQEYGSMRQSGVVHSYETVEFLKKFESRPVLQRAGLVGKKEKAKAKPAAEAKK